LTVKDLEPNLLELIELLQEGTIIIVSVVTEEVGVTEEITVTTEMISIETILTEEEIMEIEVTSVEEISEDDFYLI
jgi:hypothetical protein